MRGFLLATGIAFCAVPAAAQVGDEPDGVVDLEAIDRLFSDSVVTAPEDENGEAVSAEAPDDATEAPDAGPPETASEEPAEEPAPEAERGPTDLDVAYAAYGECMAASATELEEQGFALDAIGSEAMLHCSVPRAAYVNAFYFSLLPSNPGADEQTVRAQAEQFVGRFDAYFRDEATRDATALRANRPADDQVISE